MANTLAANGSSWLLASDVIGIEEVINAQSGYPDLEYAMFVDLNNKVLGFTDRSKVGSFLVDDISQQLLNSSDYELILLEDPLQIDVAKAVVANNEIIGWARVNLNRTSINKNLRVVSRNGILYMLFAIIVGIVFAWLMAQGLTSAIRHMRSAAKQVEEGVKGVDFKVDRRDELGSLSQSFNNMVHSLDNKERLILTFQQHLEQLVDERTEELNESNLKLKASNKNINAQKKDLEQAYQQLEVMQEQLIESEKLSALGSLVIGVSHELNTPLGTAYTAITSARLSIDEVLRQLETNSLTKLSLQQESEQLSALIDLIIDNLETLIRTINSFKKISAEQNKDCLCNFHIKRLLQDCTGSFSASLNQQNLSISVEMDHDYEIYGDPNQFSFIFINLINNSLIHAFKNRDSGKISIRASLELHILSIVYQDDGIGMTEDQVNHIYDPFFTSQLGKGGSGLGMNIVYNIVHQGFHGEIHCHSKLGSGSQFIITLPFPSNTSHQL